MKKLLLISIAPVLFITPPLVLAADYPEFGGRCAMGVVLGKEVKTDCSVDYAGPKGNQICFGNQQAKDDFLKNEEENLRKAFANYDQVVM